MKFTENDLCLWPAAETYLLEILNGEYSVEDAREDLQSLIDLNKNEEGEWMTLTLVSLFHALVMAVFILYLLLVEKDYRGVVLFLIIFFISNPLLQLRLFHLKDK